MSLETIIENFVKGLGSAALRAGALKAVLSSAIADGVEGGIDRAMPTLMKNTVLGSVILTGVFLFGLGIAKWAESIIAAPGSGFIITGIVLTACASICLLDKSRAAGK
ncbi:MAG TPA: hypothetical protein VJH23_06440 [archaeon]|nr:hypothetical protein [archaeon]